MDKKLTSSLEDYLEIIFNKINKNSKVRAVDISRELNVSRASVTEALNKLAKSGFINYEKYGQIILTEDGIKKAKEIVFLHQELTSFFENLGVDTLEASENACKIEHIISNNVKKRIQDFNEFCKANPDFKF